MAKESAESAEAFGPGTKDAVPSDEQLGDSLQRENAWSHLQALYAHVNQDKSGDAVKRDKARAIIDSLARILLGDSAKFDRDTTLAEAQK